jgi:hypothetical protein
MFGFLVGALCLIGMVAVLRRSYAFGHHGGWYRGWYGGRGRRDWQGGWGEREPGRGFGVPGRARRMLRWVYERLGTSPAQETVLADAAEAMVGAVESFRGEWEQSRSDVARALRSELFDASALKAVFGRHDERIHAVREVLLTQAERIHEVLDGRQRALLAELLERGRSRGRWNV